jgi:nucleoside-diphosphate-sugar epimerase
MAMVDGDVDPINLVSGHAATTAHVIALLCELTGTRIPIERRQPTAPPRSLQFDVSRLRARFQLPIATPLEEGLRAEVQWFRERLGLL